MNLYLCGSPPVGFLLLLLSIYLLVSFTVPYTISVLTLRLIVKVENKRTRRINAALSAVAFMILLTVIFYAFS